jgi:hypothetical protein
MRVVENEIALHTSLAPRSGERVPSREAVRRVRRHRSSLKLPLTRLASPMLATLSPQVRGEGKSARSL